MVRILESNYFLMRTKLGYLRYSNLNLRLRFQNKSFVSEIKALPLELHFFFFESKITQIQLVITTQNLSFVSRIEVLALEKQKLDSGNEALKLNRNKKLETKL